MRDPKTSIQPAHHINFALHTSAGAGTPVDMARHEACLFTLPVFSVASANGTIQLQDSDDGVSFANVDGASFTEPVAAATAATRFVLVRDQDVRRYVRLGFNPNGGSLNFAASALLLNATQPPTAVTYSVDTSTI